MRIVGGVWSGRRIAAPAGRQTRPTSDRVREAWMSALGPELQGARVLDLFAGSGALGIEALSRGAAHTTFVESGSPAIAALRRNLLALAVPDGAYRLVRGDVFRFVATAPERGFDVALADPPYDRGDAARLARAFTDRPFSRILCIEHSRAEPVAADPVWQRRYGDSQLTFLRAPDDDDS